MKHKEHTAKPDRRTKQVRRCILGLWLLVILLVFFNRNLFTVQNIIERSPDGILPVSLLLLTLFALKSVSVVIYSGILFVSAGLLLPPWFSIPVVVLGIIIMVSIPFFLGRALGEEEAARLIQKYPKLGPFHELRRRNDLFFSFLARITSIIPSDPFSTYMGAVNASYPRYLLGSLLGMLPGTLMLTLLGDSAGDFTSPAFLAMACMKVIALLIAFSFLLRQKKTLRPDAEASNTDTG